VLVPGPPLWPVVPARPGTVNWAGPIEARPPGRRMEGRGMDGSDPLPVGDGRI
jgi:hypothetical protein